MPNDKMLLAIVLFLAGAFLFHNRAFDLAVLTVGA